MAGPLAALERFFERIFERPPARLFAPAIQLEHLQRQLFRTLEGERAVRGRRTYVPTSYRVQLNPADLAALSDHPALSTDLAEAVRAHARSRGYVLASRPHVTLEAAAGLEPGEVAVLSVDVGSPPPAERRRLNGSPGRNGHSGSAPAGGLAPADIGLTSTFQAARPATPTAAISVQVPGRSPWRVGLGDGRMRVGRSQDNDLVLPDDRVSRHHGQISVRFGTLVYSDLGSTNGSYVNGVRVTEIALGPSDVLQLGGSSLTVESGQ